MDPGDALLLAIALSVTGTLAVTCAIGWVRASRRVRHLERQLSGAAPDTAVAQLEANLAVLSEHVDELANGHDFLSRLVTERKHPSGAQQPASTTPTRR
jgi:hypothetical protein